MSVIWLKQKFWTLGEDNKVYKLFIFSLSTEFINFAKDKGCADVFTEDNCTTGVILLTFWEKKKIKKKLYRPLVFPVRFYFCQFKQLETPNSAGATNETFNLLPFQSDWPQWCWVSVFCLCIYMLSQTTDIHGELQTLHVENFIWICILYWTTCKTITIISNHDRMKISVVDSDSYTVQVTLRIFAGSCWGTHAYHVCQWNHPRRKTRFQNLPSLWQIRQGSWE